MATISSTIELVDKMSSTLSTIESNIETMKSTLQGVADKQSAIDGFSWETFASNAEAAGKRISKVGSQMTLALTAPLLMLGKKMYNSSTEHEAAYVAMKKTVEAGRATEEQYQAINDTVMELSESTPLAYTELMDLAQTAGNAGVGVDAMEDFLKVYSALQYATDQHISGGEGIKSVMSFLNITDGGSQNVERFANSLAYLGVNANSTEDEILQMANRFASAATLAGFSKDNIIGMAAAFESVGIRAEAGGSSAAKLIKQMQLATEVGSTAQSRLAGIGENYESALDFVNAWNSMKSGDKADIANQLGMTVEAVGSMGDSWMLLEQFAQVSGKTSEQFVKDWSTDPAQAMSAFFTGLNAAGDEGTESVLAILDKMGLTEIRESNLIAAMAKRPEMFAQMLAVAAQGWDENSSMWEQFGTQMETQESQNEMLGNKLDNTMANLGDNLVQALQPALDVVNGLLEAFNGLSESDQTLLIEALGAIALLGPSLKIVGTAVEGIGKLTKVVSKAGKIKDLFTTIGTFFTTPVGAALGVAAAVVAVCAAIESIPTNLENLVTAAQDIPITIDEASYNDTMTKIQQVQEALNGLKPGEVKPEYENTVAAVEYGYGTNEMYGSALAYEAAKANAQINQVASEYAEKMNAAQAKIAEAAGNHDDAAAQAARDEFDALKAALDAEMASMKADYSAKISSLFTGMASEYPEAANILSNAISNYDVMKGAYNLIRSDDWYNYETEEQGEALRQQGMSVLEQAFNAGLLDDYKQGFNEIKQLATGMTDTDFWTWENVSAAIENGTYTPFSSVGDLLQDVLEKTTSSMNEALQAASDNPELNSWLLSIFNDPSIMENMDVNALQGALAGLVRTLDYKAAVDAAGNNANDFGKYLAEGLGNGITDNEGIATGAASTMGNNVITNLKSALGVASPSTFMIEAGLNVVQGLEQGISNNADTAVGAASAMGASAVAGVTSVLNMFTGLAIGVMFDAGLAAGIMAGRSTVIAAAVATAVAALAAAKGALGIASPSKETYWMGEMLIKGYSNAIHDGSRALNQTINKTLDSAKDTWDSGSWDLISGWADLEQQALQDEFNNVSDGVSISDSDIKKIRTLAEREVINKFTTAEVKVEMTNNNNISSDMDIDGIIESLEDKLTERLEAVAEGVYT